MNKDDAKKRLIPLLLVMMLVAVALALVVAGTVSAMEPEDWYWERLLLAGPPDPTYSSLIGDPDTIRADGVSTSTITARVRDSINDPCLDAFVGITTTAGTLNYPTIEAEDTTLTPGVGWTTVISPGSGASPLFGPAPHAVYVETRFALSPTAQLQWTFDMPIDGGGVAVRYWAAPDGDKIRFELDGNLAKVVDTYDSSAHWEAELITSGISAGTHTLVGKYSGETHAGRCCVRLDFFWTGPMTGQDCPGGNCGNAIEILTSEASHTTIVADLLATIIQNPWITETCQVTFTGSTCQQMDLILDDSEIALGSSTIARAYLTDTFGLPIVDGYVVTWTSGNVNIATTGVTTSTTVGGVATTTIDSATQTGLVLITATASGCSDSEWLRVTGPPCTMTLTASNTDPECNEPITLTAYITDCWGNSVAVGTPVTWTSTSAVSTFNPNPSYTDGYTSTTVYTPAELGAQTITAQVDSITATLDINVWPGPPEVVVVEHSPDTVPACGGPLTCTAIVTVTVYDACGGCVDDGTAVTITTGGAEYGCLVLPGTTACLPTVVGSVSGCVVTATYFAWSLPLTTPTVPVAILSSLLQRTRKSARTSSMYLVRRQR